MPLPVPSQHQNLYSHHHENKYGRLPPPCLSPAPLYPPGLTHPARTQTGEGREELFNHGLVDTPEMTAKSRLSDNFIDMANLNDDEAPSSSEGMEPDEESRESNDSGGEDEQQKKFDRMCR